MFPIKHIHLHLHPLLRPLGARHLPQVVVLMVVVLAVVVLVLAVAVVVVVIVFEGICLQTTCIFWSAVMQRPPEEAQYEKIFTSRIDNTRKYSHLELTIL